MTSPKITTLKFECFEFSRYMSAGRTMYPRGVSAEQCQCTDDPERICDSTSGFTLIFQETPDEKQAATIEEEHKELVELFKKSAAEVESDYPANGIGSFHPIEKTGYIHVPPRFLDNLWEAALAADGVLRLISLTIQPQEGGWAVLGVHLRETPRNP